MNYHKSLMSSKGSGVRENNIPQLYHRPVPISDLRTHLQLYEELQWIYIYIYFSHFLVQKTAHNSFGTASVNTREKHSPPSRQPSHTIVLLNW